MSRYNRKGYMNIKARHPRTGRIFSAAIPVGSPVAQSIERRQRKAEKARRAQLREQKARLREIKKSVPIELRASVNWNQLFEVANKLKDAHEDAAD